MVEGLIVYCFLVITKITSNSLNIKKSKRAQIFNVIQFSKQTVKWLIVNDKK